MSLADPDGLDRSAESCRDRCDCGRDPLFSVVAPKQSSVWQTFLTEFLGRNIWIVAFQDESGSGLSLPNSEAGNRLRLRLHRVGAEEHWQATWAVSNALVQSGLKDTDADRLMKEVSIDAIQADPSNFSYQAFRRIVNFWRCAATDLPAQGVESGAYFGQVSWKHNLPMIEWAIDHRWSQSVSWEHDFTARTHRFPERPVDQPDDSSLRNLAGADSRLLLCRHGHLGDTGLSLPDGGRANRCPGDRSCRGGVVVLETT